MVSLDPPARTRAWLPANGRPPLGCRSRLGVGLLARRSDSPVNGGANFNVAQQT